MDPKDQSASPADTHEDDKEKGAESSTANDGNLDSSQDADDLDAQSGMLAAIKEAAGTGDDTDDDADTADSDDSDADPGDDDAGGGADKDGEDPGKAGADKGAASAEEDDDGEDLDPNQRVPYPRFQEVVRQKNRYRDEARTVSEERDRYKQGHENFQAIESFRQRNDLTDRDVVQALQIAGAINKDPAAALEQLNGLVAQLNEVVGNTLPADLKARVESGELPEADALELSRARRKDERRQHEDQAAQQRRREEQGHQDLQQRQTRMAQAASAEEKRLADRDPEFAKKSPLIKAELQRLIQERRPQSPEDAVGLVQEAYQAVTKTLKGLTRRPDVRKGVATHDEEGISGAESEPASMLDAMKKAAHGQ